MSLEARVIGNLTGRHAQAARAIWLARRGLRDGVANGRGMEDDFATIQYVIRSMNDVFKSQIRAEAAWRRRVYSGAGPYSLEDDAGMVTMYREWARTARLTSKAARLVRLPNRSLQGLRTLKRRAAELAWFIDSPPVRLIDLPRVGLKTDPAGLDVAPLSRYIAEHPEQAERILARTAAAEKSIAEGEVRPLSEYLLSRNGG